MNRQQHKKSPLSFRASAGASMVDVLVGLVVSVIVVMIGAQVMSNTLKAKNLIDQRGNDEDLRLAVMLTMSCSKTAPTGSPPAACTGSGYMPILRNDGTTLINQVAAGQPYTMLGARFIFRARCPNSNILVEYAKLPAYARAAPVAKVPQDDSAYSWQDLFKGIQIGCEVH